MERYFVLCWAELNEMSAELIGPYYSVEDCEWDIKDSKCGHKHHFSRGTPPPEFKVWHGCFRQAWNDEQKADWVSFNRTRAEMEDMKRLARHG